MRKGEFTMKGLVCSRKEKVPLCVLSYNSDGQKVATYAGHNCTEPIEIHILIAFLFTAVRANPGKMIYSPEKHIPLGVAVHDQGEIYSLEVKSGRKRDTIRLSTYFTLLMESEA